MKTEKANPGHFETIIESHSDYNAHNPYWINLYHGIKDKVIRQSVSDALNDFFHKHGPDANEDYTGCCGPLMKRETCEKALRYAFRKAKYKGDIFDVIDGGFSVEDDGRENDPVTGELLHAVPVYKPFIIDEIDCLREQDKLSKDDWVWLNFVTAGFGTHDSDVNAKLRQLTRKHR